MTHHHHQRCWHSFFSFNTTFLFPSSPSTLPFPPFSPYLAFSPSSLYFFLLGLTPFSFKLTFTDTYQRFSFFSLPPGRAILHLRFVFQSRPAGWWRKVKVRRPRLPWVGSDKKRRWKASSLASRRLWR